jgi:ESS family glutamate:Na+ symporter
VFGGVILINIATRFRWTRLVSSANSLPEGMRRGLLPADDRPSMGKETVSPMALDPLAWHAALVLTAFTLALGVQSGAKYLFPGDYSLPLFALAVLTGALLQRCLNVAGTGEYVDRRVITRIGSTASDYLIACGIASIKIFKIADFWMPLLFLSLVGIAYSVAMLWFVGQKIYRNFWFERSVFTYGWNTGVVASGYTLLRVVDPRLRSKTIEEYGAAYALIAPLNIALLIVVPPLVANGYLLSTGVVLAGIAITAVCLSAWLVGWNRSPPSALRAGERSVIDDQTDDRH